MDSNISFRKIRSVSNTEYVKWILDARMILFLSLNIFIFDYVTRVMIDNSEKMGKPINVIEPFIAISNSSLLLFVMPVVFLALISDFPKSDGNAMFYMIRTGKVNWFLGQMLFAVKAGLTYVGAIFVISCGCVMSHSYIYNEWSDVVYKYYKYFPNDTENLMLELISERLYNNLTPLEALVHTTCLLMLMIMMIALVQLLAFSYSVKIAGLLANICMLCIGIGTTLFSGVVKWIFPVSNAVTWMHYDEIFKKQIVPIRNSYLYFIVIITVLVVWNAFMFKRYDFSKVKDLED